MPQIILSTWVQIRLGLRENNLYGSNVSQRCKVLSVIVRLFYFLFFNSVYAQHTCIHTNLKELSSPCYFLLNTRMKCLMAYTKRWLLWNLWYRCMVSSNRTAWLTRGEKLLSIWWDALRWPYRLDYFQIF